MQPEEEVQIIVEERLLPPMAVLVTPAEQEHQEALRLRSYELAVQRGHVRRG